jgi:excisionase family DNA binding protein
MAERGELSLEQAAERLSVSKMTVLRLIGSGTIQADQACKGAPWAIRAAQISTLDLRSSTPLCPVTGNPDQGTFVFQ